MDVLLDASVIIAGCHSRTGASAVIFGLIGAKEINGHVSTTILDESRRNLTRRFPKTTLTHYYRLLTLPLIVHPKPTRPQIERFYSLIRAKDAHVLAAAESAKVDCLVTLDRKDFKQTPVMEAVSFRIVTPGELLQELKRS